MSGILLGSTWYSVKWGRFEGYGDREISSFIVHPDYKYVESRPNKRDEELYQAHWEDRVGQEPFAIMDVTRAT